MRRSSFWGFFAFAAFCTLAAAVIFQTTSLTDRPWLNLIGWAAWSTGVALNLWHLVWAWRGE